MRLVCLVQRKLGSKCICHGRRFLLSSYWAAVVFQGIPRAGSGLVGTQVSESSRCVLNDPKSRGSHGTECSCAWGKSLEAVTGGTRSLSDYTGGKLIFSGHTELEDVSVERHHEPRPVRVVHVSPLDQVAVFTVEKGI